MLLYRAVERLHARVYKLVKVYPEIPIVLTAWSVIAVITFH